MTTFNFDPIAFVSVIALFAVIPIALFGSIYLIVNSVQQRKIAEAYARQGLTLPPKESKQPRKVGDMVLVRALALIGLALGLGIGQIWGLVRVTVALMIGLCSLGMIGGWYIVRSKDKTDVNN